ncbi:MAG: response regulator [Acidobacteria bacterium]|nr:response regulator [Acidobacteriota bacterium]
MHADARKTADNGLGGAKNPAPPTILVVDDEPLIRWSLKESLLDAGFSVADAPDARGALEFFAPDAPPIDAVLLDLRLPDVNGLSLLQYIKRAAPRCPVILMTAFGTPETLEAAMKHGADITVTKPFGVDEMVGLVNRVLHPPKA